MSGVLFHALCATLDHLSAGFVASLQDGKILHLNKSAREMVDAGWPIKNRRGYLQAEDRRRTELLLSSLGRIAHSASFGGGEALSLDICLSRDASADGVALATIKPLIVGGGDIDGNETVVALYITKVGAQRCPSLAGIAECYDLTPAETRTLEHFSGGGTVAEVAEALDLSENTVKTHLQKVFTKTRSSRQPQLMRLVNELTPPLRESSPLQPSRTLSRARVQQRRRAVYPSTGPQLPH
jgi:DNA-binding CsgD family transcriptional regulator